MVWRHSRPKWLCRRNGHVPWEKANPVHVNGFYLCGCSKWFPGDDPFDKGTNHVVVHPRFSLSSPISHTFNLNNGTVSATVGQPPLTCDKLEGMTTTPFMYLRENPEELEKMDFLEIRQLIINRLAEYEDGMDAA